MAAAHDVASVRGPRFCRPLLHASSIGLPERPSIAQIRATGATTLAAIAEGLNAAAIPTPRGQGKWSPVQVKRTLQALAEGTFVKKKEPMRVN